MAHASEPAHEGRRWQLHGLTPVLHALIAPGDNNAQNFQDFLLAVQPAPTMSQKSLRQTRERPGTWGGSCEMLDHLPQPPSGRKRDSQIGCEPPPASDG